MSPNRRPPPCRMFQESTLTLVCYSRDEQSRSGKQHRGGRTTADRTRDRELSLHASCQIARDREPEPDTGVSSSWPTVGLKERLEDPRDLLLRNPDAGVADPDPDTGTLTLRAERDHAAIARVLRRVRE